MVLAGTSRVGAVVPEPPVGIEVPFLPQTERLCGGAAAAMVFRFWGERHADVQQFAPLVDRRAGGIPAERLVDAIVQRGWTAERVDGTIEALRENLGRGQPLILLVEVRPRRYHFVVAVSAGPEHVYVHDPAIGPYRRYSVSALTKAWAPTGNWMLRVRPDRTTPRTVGGPSPVAPASPPASRADTACDQALAEAVDQVRQRGLGSADALLGAVRTQCPSDSRPVSELAGVRFAERRLAESVHLAEQATKLDPTDAYAWDLLGSSRFVTRDVLAALDAWNAIDKPRLDSVQLDRLTFTQYSLAARFLGLSPGRLLTRAHVERAERRLRDLPARWTSRLDVVPDEDGWATVRAAIVERPRRPRGWFAWTSAAVESLARREVTAGVAGWNGRGDMWTAGWRWWANRPRVTLSYAAPLAGPVPGVVGVMLSQASQRYATGESGDGVVQDHLRGGISLGHWLTGAWRYEVSGGLDRWDGSRAAASIGAGLDRRLAGDRVSLTAAGRNGWPVSDDAGFRTGSVAAVVRSKPTHEGLVVVLQGSYSVASRWAPLSEWPGAGDQGAGSALLRAHPLTQGGIVDGVGFGRRLASATVEGRRWLRKPAIVGLGVAAFADLARATDGLRPERDRRLHVDVGAGMRFRIPGRDGLVRIDYGHGIRDRARALTLGWIQ